MTALKLQRLLFWAAWAIAAVLLGRFSLDFIREMPALLAAPFVLLVVVTLAIAAMNIVSARDSAPAALERTRAGVVATALLLLSVPLGFLASSLDCTGLSLAGCTPFCTFIKTVWIPALALACIALAVRRSLLLVGLILLMSVVPLAPHCLCFNVGNGWWIERLGASPTCYVWGFAVSLIALGAIRAGKREWLSLLVNAAIIGGAMTFFVAHHYFHYPW
jgi:hypothetical protein